MTNEESRAVANIIPPRIPYRPAAQNYDVDQDHWNALCDAVFPNAKTADGIMLALAYCKRRNLDPFKRPVHIVPIWDSVRKRMVETVWPGINELRTTAFRTGKYAGCDPAEFGPDDTLDYTLPTRDSGSGGDHPNAPPSDEKPKASAAPKRSVTYPKWCQITVYRLVGNERIAFPGPRVYWLESYATAGRNTDAPNEMWADRSRGQLEKVAEAAALRKAFPEELAGEYSIDEAPRMVDITPQPEPVPAARPTLASVKAEDRKATRKAKEAKPDAQPSGQGDSPAGEGQGNPDDEQPPASAREVDGGEPAPDKAGRQARGEQVAEGDREPSPILTGFLGELQSAGSIQTIDAIKGRAKAELGREEFGAFMNAFLARQRQF